MGAECLGASPNDANASSRQLQQAADGLRSSVGTMLERQGQPERAERWTPPSGWRSWLLIISLLAGLVLALDALGLSCGSGGC